MIAILDMESELAAELYVDDRVDGQGMPIAGGLTRVAFCVRLDKVGSASDVIRFDSRYDHEKDRLELLPKEGPQ